MKVKMSCKRKLTILALWGLSWSVWGQTEQVQISFYKFAPGYYNPALAGIRGHTSIGLVQRLQWVGIEDAPKTTLLLVDMPLKGKLSTGGVLGFDVLGPYSNLFLSNSWAYALNLDGRDNILSLGVAVEAYMYFLDATKFDASERPLLDEGFNAKPTFALGLYWYNRLFFAGLSTKLAFPTKVLKDKELNALSLQNYFYALAGMDFPVGTMKLQPSVFLKYIINAPLATDINIDMMFSSRLTGGLLYRVGENAGLHIILTLNNIIVGYSFEYSLSGLARIAPTTHEVMVSFLPGGAAIRRRTSVFYGY